MELKFNLKMPEFVLKLLQEKGIEGSIGGPDKDRVIIKDPGNDIAEMHRRIKEATGLAQDADYSTI